MEDNYYLQDCGDNDVVCFGDTTYKVSKFKEAVNQSFNSSMGQVLIRELGYRKVEFKEHLPYEEWFNTGKDCEILNLGSQKWKKGKVKIKVSLEFYVEEEESKETENDETIPNQPESPLDDLRKAIAEGKLAE